MKTVFKKKTNKTRHSNYPPSPRRAPAGFRPGFRSQWAYQKDPGIVFGAKRFFGGLGYQGQETRHLQEMNVFWHCQKTNIFIKMSVGLGTKKPLGT